VLSEHRLRGTTRRAASNESIAGEAMCVPGSWIRLEFICRFARIINYLITFWVCTLYPYKD
jgi:hypothetical protein